MSESISPSRYARIGAFLLRYRKAGLFNGLELDLQEAALAQDARPVAPGQPEQFVDELEALGPTFIKVGQALSTRPDMVPPAYLDALERMQDNVAPVPVAEICTVVEAELGARIGVLFGSFDAQPLAAGSMAQVHAATLRDGREVVVKVQRPHIAQTLRDDLAILEKLAGAADHLTEMGRRYGFSDWVRELRHSLANEVNFALEADNLRRFAANLRGYRHLYVPQPLDDFTTARVLTMDRVRGIKVTHVPPVRRLEHPLQEQAQELLRAYLDQVFVHGLVHADPHPGNVLLMDDHRLALFDLGMVARLPPHTRHHLLKLMLGAISGNSEQVGEISETLGTALQDFSHSHYRRCVDQLVSGYAGLQGASRQFSEGRLILELTRVGAACGLRPPPELTILGKTLLNLEAVTTALDPALDTRAVVEQHLQQMLRRQALGSLSPANLASEWLDLQELARRTPQHMGAILRTLAENRLRVRIDGLEESRMMESLQKIANRIATGVIIAALVIGAALTARLPGGIRLFGLPLLSALFILVAAVLGAGLILSALRRDRKVDRAADRMPD
ncbi:ABC1 kinase family protein [Rhodanobacter lindaniclasticus]|uniref:ABC transporter substrate-binding protein n=1 Tax=Rhodanobacter lindaniclasticus TaxID=75310 RepID=A0A4S3KC44_9GAMM|nr:AarF/UbiB family protein [Rhodanobacter lindaniclasticus]THD05982.1 ABC transporter substrate-binding protein [Rhodanobacter lindaniclasticus]